MLSVSILLKSISFPREAGRGGKTPGRNSPVKMIQAWKQHNLYGKLSASTSDSGNVSEGFERILSTSNVGWSWTMFLRAAHHCYIFSTIKPAITCCSRTLLFQYTLKEIALYIFKLYTLKSHSSRTWKIASFYLSIGHCADLFNKAERRKQGLVWSNAPGAKQLLYDFLTC